MRIPSALFGCDVNPEVRKTFVLAPIITQMRRYFERDSGLAWSAKLRFTAVHGGQQRVRSIPHQQYLGLPLFLRICEFELYLQEILVGGICDGVYEFGENVPKRRHGPKRISRIHFRWKILRSPKRLHLDDANMVGGTIEQRTEKIHGKTKNSCRW